MQQILYDVDIGDLQPDVAVQTAGDEAADQAHDVADGLPAVFGDALEGDGEGILALKGVDVAKYGVMCQWCHENGC